MTKNSNAPTKTSTEKSWSLPATEQSPIKGSIVIDPKGRSRRNFRFLRQLRGVPDSAPPHYGPRYWGISVAILHSVYKEWCNGRRSDSIVRQLQQFRGTGRQAITFRHLRREWAALGLDIRDARSPLSANKPGYGLLQQGSRSLQIQLAQETGLSYETVRARALRAIFVYGIDLRDEALIIDTDPRESDLPPSTKEI